MLEFPLDELLDEAACYEYLKEVLHPDGLHCPLGHKLPAEQAPHCQERAPLVSYRCRECGAVYHLFTGTILSGTHYKCSTIVQLLRGITQGTSTSHLARELGHDRGNLLAWRHRFQELALAQRPPAPLPDGEVEADESLLNAGEKGDDHPDPQDPPRRRANKRRGRGTMANDRPPIVGVVGRDSDQVRLAVAEDTRQATIVPQVEAATAPTAQVYTDAAESYTPLAATGRGHASVNHSHEWARDDDGDGLREVHNNTMEGFWTGLRTFLRPFRGVHKRCLDQYVAVFEWVHNLKRVSPDFLRLLLCPHFTYLPT